MTDFLSDGSIQRTVGVRSDFGLPSLSDFPVRIVGDDPVVPSSFRVGTAAAQAIAASCGMAGSFHRLRGGPSQEVSVALADAVTEFRSERYLRVRGGPAPELWDPIAGAYRCGDGRFVRIHTNFAHHRDGILRLLGCAHERTAVAAALERWTGAEFERVASDAGLVVGLMRSFAEWDDTDQAFATARQPLVEVTRAGDAPARSLEQAVRPLEGVKVVEMTRIIAGPVCGRVLAAHGAEVLRLIGPDVPTIEPLDMDTGHGKRSAFLNLRDRDDRERLDGLLAKADVFLHSYRPGSLDGYGFDDKTIHERHPGLIHASLSAYGPEGPWAARRGFDSLVQTATGFNDAEGAAFGLDEPKALPVQVLDHATGHLLAAGIMAALERRACEGGGWLVRASLARTGLWLRSLGQMPQGVSAPDRAHAESQKRLEDVESAYGRLVRVRPAATMSATSPHFVSPSAPYGMHLPSW